MRLIAPLLVLAFLVGLIGTPRAQSPLHDENLPSVKPEALQQLSDTRIRQQLMQQSQAPYRGRCVCPYQTHDINGHSCTNRHEVVHSYPQPLCYPSQVTRAMIRDWKRLHSAQ